MEIKRPQINNENQSNIKEPVFQVKTTHTQPLLKNEPTTTAPIIKNRDKVTPTNEQPQQPQRQVVDSGNPTIISENPSGTDLKNMIDQINQNQAA